MRGAGVITLGYCFQLSDQLNIAREIFFVKARVAAAAIGLGKIIHALDAPGEQAAPERRIGDVAHAEFLARGHDVFFNVAKPQRVFGLQRGQRMFGMRAAQCLGAGFADADKTHLAARDQLTHRAYGLFNRHAGVNTMQKIDVDHIQPHALQAFVATLVHVFRAAIGGLFAIGQIDVAKLGGDDHIAAAAL